MKAIIIIITFSFVPFLLIAQHEKIFDACGTELLLEALRNSIPGFIISENDQEEKYRSLHNIGLDFPRSSEAVILPVVFHIIHDDGPENIPDLQVQQALEYLNDAFRNRNNFYHPDGADVLIEFCLAERNPNGQTSSGIVRYKSPLTDMSTHYSHSQLASLATWDTKRYINIRLVREACLGNCNPAGYAFQPSAHGFIFDGIVMEAEFAGTNKQDAIVLIHEMGHYFGLDHTFQGGCTNDNCLKDGDKVCDTPPDNITGPFPCEVTYNSCTTDSDDNSINNPFRSFALGGIGGQNDMHSNYMDYSDYECYDRFTQEQSSRMNFFLQEVRSSLITSKGCLLPCQEDPIALFQLNMDTIVAGSIVYTTNLSMNASAYTWYINNNNAGNASDTFFQFNTEGEFRLKLVAFSPLPECDSTIFELNILVTCPVTANYSYYIESGILYISSLSDNAENVLWTIKDASGNLFYTSTELIDTINISGIEYLQLCLRSNNQYCSDTKCEFINLTGSGIEICNNEVDDDNDSFVDLFDSDCICINTAYQAYCPINCEYVPDSFPEFRMKLKWQSEIIGQSRAIIPNIVTGDIDNDQKIEVISKKSLGLWSLNNAINNTLIINGQDGTSKFEYNSVQNLSSNDDKYISIADLDRDGNAEIISLEKDTLVCFQNKGNLIWKSDPLDIGYGRAVNIADFNHDGIPEIYEGNNIVNSLNGETACFGI